MAWAMPLIIILTLLIFQFFHSNLSKDHLPTYIVLIIFFIIGIVIDIYKRK